MTTIALDTNCINAKEKDETLNELQSLCAEGKVQIYKTDVMDTEMQDNYSPGLRKSKNLTEDLGDMVVGHSRVGHGVIGSENDEKIFVEILGILFDRKDRAKYTSRELRDAMMVKTHMEHKRTFLVTRDKGLLNKAKTLQEKFNVEIVDPERCLSRISK